MRWRTVVFVGIGIAAAGCSSSTGPTGTVTGTYIRSGGPSGTPNMPLLGTISFRSGSGSVITVNSDSTGRFTGQMPPGTYSVTATSSLINDGNSPCSQVLTTKVLAGKTVTLSLVCAVP
jgi:hypothetical protein